MARWHYDWLLTALCEAVEALGARVRLGEPGENLVRRLPGRRARRDIAIPPARRHVGPPCVEVCVEGLPNLLHEVAHIVSSRTLDDDHGIDYGAIPFDLAAASGRATLFEELACCVLSCSYMPGSDVDRDAWFVEQVEIQPVFYGMEDDVPAFWHSVDRTCAEHTGDAEAAVDTAFCRVESLLRWSGAPATLASAPRRLGLAQMLGRRPA